MVYTCCLLGLDYIVLGEPALPILLSSWLGNVWCAARCSTSCVLTASAHRTSCYCRNRDNSGPSADIFNSTIAMLRSEHPKAHVFASNFDDFFAQAEDQRHLLPIVRQEIGDTWLYGIPTGEVPDSV